MTAKRRQSWVDMGTTFDRSLDKDEPPANTNATGKSGAFLAVAAPGWILVECECHDSTE
jgi:hypothetical protein